MNSVSEIYDDMGYNVADFDNSISQMGSSIANTLELVHNLESQLSDSITKLVDFKSSGTYSLLQTAVAFNTEELASFIICPYLSEQLTCIQLRIMAQLCHHFTEYYQYGLVH